MSASVIGSEQNQGISGDAVTFVAIPIGIFQRKKKPAKDCIHPEMKPARFAFLEFWGESRLRAFFLSSQVWIGQVHERHRHAVADKMAPSGKLADRTVSSMASANASHMCLGLPT